MTQHKGFTLDKVSNWETLIYTTHRVAGEIQRGTFLGQTRTIADARRQIDKGLWDDDANRANAR